MAADGNITKDVIYDAVAPDDFESMLELDRYNARSTAFDKIISATHDHFWIRSTQSTSTSARSSTSIRSTWSTPRS